MAVASSGGHCSLPYDKNTSGLVQRVWHQDHGVGLSSNSYQIKHQQDALKQAQSMEDPHCDLQNPGDSLPLSSYLTSEDILQCPKFIP